MKIKMIFYQIITLKWKVVININIKIIVIIIINQGIRNKNKNKNKVMIRKVNKGVIKFNLILVKMLMRRSWGIF